MDSVNVDELRKALSESLKENARLKESAEQKEATTDSNTTTAVVQCRFLDMIPLEIRNLIYGYLLVDPMLAEVESVLRSDKDEQSHPSQKYELSPELLSTCRQIYDETSDFLYCSKLS